MAPEAAQLLGVFAAAGGLVCVDAAAGILVVAVVVSAATATLAARASAAAPVKITDFFIIISLVSEVLKNSTLVAVRDQGNSVDKLSKTG